MRTSNNVQLYQQSHWYLLKHVPVRFLLLLRRILVSGCQSAISHIENKQREGDKAMNGKHLSKELEIFEAAGKITKNIKLLLNKW